MVCSCTYYGFYFCGVSFLDVIMDGDDGHGGDNDD